MTILAIDHGTRRIGYAISDPDGILAIPLKVIEVSDRASAVESARKMCEEHTVDRVLVGLPLNMDGSRGPAVELVEEFCSELRRVMAIPVETWDERLTTCVSEKMLIEHDVPRAKRKKLRDKLAAQIFLQDYLDSRALEGGNPLPPD